ncbi:hypothetical protein [Thioalkalivibrio sp. HK1]|uniref:hypothetical protein n=1 Tax=Thioalkalivibrio sp. HK1 TaxID=1469245 RepID=UPI000470395F|nr:hypothetical protein [Thioalkalivibrio sp. HK1]
MEVQGSISRKINEKNTIMREVKRIEPIEDISIDNQGRVATLGKIERYITEQRRVMMALAIVAIAALARYLLSGDQPIASQQCPKG